MEVKRYLLVIKTQKELKQFTWKGNLDSGEIYNLSQGSEKHQEEYKVWGNRESIIL